jgi:cytochrome P450 family 4
MGEMFFRRASKPWFQSDIIFSLSPLGRQQQKDLDILHGFTWSIIRTRKQELLERSKHLTANEDLEVLGE